MIQHDIYALVTYALKTGLIEKEDRIYTINRLLELFQMDTLEAIEVEENKEDGRELEEILASMMD